MRKYLVRFTALGYLAVILLAPLSMLFWRIWQEGIADAWSAISDPQTLHAFKITLILAGIRLDVLV